MRCADSYPAQHSGDLRISGNISCIFTMVLLCILTLCKRRLQSNVDLHRGASETLFGKGKFIIVE